MEYCSDYWNCSLCDLRNLIDITQNPGWISGYDAVRRNVLGDYAAGSNDRVFTDCGAAENGCARTDRRAFPDYCTFDFPVRFGLQVAFGGRRAGVGVVDERYSVADKNVVLDDYAFTNECVTGDFAPLADGGVFLDFNEGPDLRFIPNFTSVQVNELGELYIFSKLYVWRDAYVRIHIHWLIW